MRPILPRKLATVTCLREDVWVRKIPPVDVSGSPTFDVNASSRESASRISGELSGL